MLNSPKPTNVNFSNAEQVCGAASIALNAWSDLRRHLLPSCIWTYLRWNSQVSTDLSFMTSGWLHYSVPEESPWRQRDTEFYLDLCSQLVHHDVKIMYPLFIHLSVTPDSNSLLPSFPKLSRCFLRLHEIASEHFFTWVSSLDDHLAFSVSEAHC